jgi:deoxycytidylate deaminase
MQDLNKKASSESLITVVLIIIALASISLASFSVMNLFDSSKIQLSSQYNCFDLQTELSSTLKIARSCIDTDGKIKALIQRNSNDLNVQSISFTLEDETWACSIESCSNCEILQAGTSRVYYFTPSNQDSIDKSLKVYIGNCLIDEMKITRCEN